MKKADLNTNLSLYYRLDGNKNAINPNNRKNSFVNLNTCKSDTVSFSGNKIPGITTNNISVRQDNAFAGIKSAQSDINAYLDKYADYKSCVDMHNLIMASYTDQAAGRALLSAQGSLHQNKDQILNSTIDSMMQTYDKLKDSNVIVVNGAKLEHPDFLNDKKYVQVKNIYLNILDRPETFRRFAFDSRDHQLERVLPDEEIDKKTKHLKYILTDILPDVLKSKTFILDDPANLHKVLSDEVIQGLVLDKLYNLAPKCNHHHADDSEDHARKYAEKQLTSALDLLKDINQKFDITTVSKIPKEFYDPLNKEKNIPDEYHDKRLFGLRQEPKNFYEAKFLNNAAKDIAGYDPENTIIVRPRNAANDIIEKVKTINQEYLFIEDWLYKYCLGDKKDKDEILETLSKSGGSESKEKFKSIANELDGYLNNYIQVYDVNKPENNAKLNNLMADYGKVNCMSEISRGYFLGIGEDSKELVKMLLGIGLFIEIAEKGSDVFGLPFLENIANALASGTDSLSSTCANYLHWKKELGDKAAKENFERTVANVLTFTLPTLLFRLSPESGTLSHLMYRNLSAVDAYSGTIETMSNYSHKLNELMEKGLKTPPNDIKNDPDKVAKWRQTEVWNAYTSHSLNRGQAWGLIASQPFALASRVTMGHFSPARSALIALASSLECFVANIYLLADNSNWHKFSNNLRESLAEKGKTNISPQEFLELRKTLLSKMVESKAGQAGLGAANEVSKHVPDAMTSKIKEGHKEVTNFVHKYLAKHVSAMLMKYLDNKYNNMTEEERKHIEGSHCGCGGHH